jgi:hypothetical protein
MDKNKQIISPFYSDDDEEAGQIIIAGLSSSNLPSAIIATAADASTQEGEAVAGVIIIDASSTMHPNREAVVDGMNIFREAIIKSHERRKMHLMIIFFDSEAKIWKPYGEDQPFMTAVEGDPLCIPKFTLDIYNMDQFHAMTALYGADLIGMASADLLAKAMEEEQGADVRQVITTIGDGFDNSSQKGNLAQVRKLNNIKALREDYLTMFYGLISPALRLGVASSIPGTDLSSMTDPEIEEFDERIFKAIACKGGDTEMEKAITNIEDRGELGGMGIPENMVAVFPSDAEEIRKMIGIKMSTTFIRGTRGQINANVPIKQQGDPDPNTPPGSFV